MIRQLIRTAALAGAALSLAGCAPDHPPVGVVTGKVTHKGKPVNYGSVMFVPAAGTPATASIGEDGSYRLSTFGDGDGALVGDHKVVVQPFRIVPRPNHPEGDDAIPVAHKKYYSVTTTPLKVAVQAGTNALDFDLH